MHGAKASETSHEALLGDPASFGKVVSEASNDYIVSEILNENVCLNISMLTAKLKCLFLCNLTYVVSYLVNCKKIV